MPSGKKNVMPINRGKMYHDFDAQFAEMKREHVTFKFFGKEYSIPATIPAILPLELSRYEEGEGVPPSLMFKVIRLMFGDDVLAEWCEHREFTIDMLGEIIKVVFGKINGTEESDDEGVTEDDVGEPVKK